VPEALFRPQLGEPHHSAYVVEDIEATVSRLVDQLGAGPFFLIENVPLENVLSRGEPAKFVHTSRSMPTTRACTTSSRWSGAPLRVGMARNRCAR